MQPYLLPYIGYFQLIACADQFIVYDDIQYTKKGWINRNRFLRGGEPVTFTVPLQKDSDFLDIRERKVAESYAPRKLLGQIEAAYRKAPYLSDAMPVIEDVLSHETETLFSFLRYGLERTCAYLGVRTPIITSSTVKPVNGTKGQDRVIDLCKAAGAAEYINPIGGLGLYSGQEFAAHSLGLKFLRAREIVYEQFGQPFQSSLSILDVMMFNSVDRIGVLLADEFDLIEPDGT